MAMTGLSAGAKAIIQSSVELLTLVSEVWAVPVLAATLSWGRKPTPRGRALGDDLLHEQVDLRRPPTGWWSVSHIVGLVGLDQVALLGRGSLAAGAAP